MALAHAVVVAFDLIARLRGRWLLIRVAVALAIFFAAGVLNPFAAAGCLALVNLASLPVFLVDVAFLRVDGNGDAAAGREGCG